MRRTYQYAAVTKDEAQRRRWTFYEAVKSYKNIYFKSQETPEIWSCSIFAWNYYRYPEECKNRVNYEKMWECYEIFYPI